LLLDYHVLYTRQAVSNALALNPPDLWRNKYLKNKYQKQFDYTQQQKAQQAEEFLAKQEELALKLSKHSAGWRQWTPLGK
ncbi:unnamed protein product, partial [marine sediment metagenome]